MRLANILILVISLVNAIKAEEENGLEGRNKACDVLIAIDQPLWEHHDKNMTLLVDLAKDHVKGLNRIYSRQVFADSYDSYYFHLKRVQVAFGICESHLFDEKNCTEQRQVFLKAFDAQSPTDFCLSYVLTFLDFHNGTAGLASVGTVCRPKFNTGFVTMLNFNLERDLDESVITFAHEVAHNFNAAHDNEFEDDADCYAQGYIMDELYNSTSRNNSESFSPCSLRAMKAKMDELTRSSTDNCFRDLTYSEEDSDLQIALCGNGIVEAGEQCGKILTLFLLFLDIYFQPSIFRLRLYH